MEVTFYQTANDFRGAMVPSIKTDDTQEKHFVTPKQAGDSVRFRATLGDSSNDSSLLYEWVAPASATVAGDTVSIPRDTPGKYTVQLRTKSDQQIVDKLNVWVIWAAGTITTSLPIASLNHMSGITTIDRTVSAGAFASLGSPYLFKFLIQPASIFDTSSYIPDLRGPKDPTGDSLLGGQSPYSSKSLSGGTVNRWDVSR